MFSAVAEQMGMDYQTAVKVSAGFGGGMNLGSVCGAVTGGIMAIGLKHGGLGQQAGLKSTALARELGEQFKARHRSINCPDLVGIDLGKYDLSKPESVESLKALIADKKTFVRCADFVRDATTIVNGMVSTASS